MKKIGLVALFALLLAGCDDGGEKKAQENLRKAEAALEKENSEMFANPANTEIHDEAVSALTMLGFAQAASQKVVAAILKEEPAAPVEKVIKLALKRL